MKDFNDAGDTIGLRQQKDVLGKRYKVNYQVDNNTHSIVRNVCAVTLAFGNEVGNCSDLGQNKVTMSVQGSQNYKIIQQNLFDNRIVTMRQ